MLLGDEFLKLVHASKLHLHVGVAPHLLGRPVEDVAHVLLFHIHFERVVVLVDDHALCPSSLHVGLEVGVAGRGGASRTAHERVAAAREEEDGQSDDNESVEPVHVEPWHFRLIVVALGIFVVVHLSDCNLSKRGKYFSVAVCRRPFPGRERVGEGRLSVGKDIKKCAVCQSKLGMCVNVASVQRLSRS